MLDGLLDDAGSTFPETCSVPEGATVQASLHLINNSNDYINAVVNYGDGSSPDYSDSSPSYDDMYVSAIA